MAFEQRLDLRRGHLVTAHAVLEDPELVLNLLGAVDRDRDAHALLGQKLDHIGTKQRRVCRQAEIDLFAFLRRAAARVFHRRLQHRKVHQRFAAEKCHVRLAVLARFAQHEVDARARGLFAHELRLVAVFGIDNLVFAVS